MSADTSETVNRGESLPAAAKDATRACERCGSWETRELGGLWLCTDCIAVAGCGCAGSSTGEE